MPKKPKYRLNVLLVIKERAKRKTEVELAKAIKRLKEEKEKLEKLELEKKALLKRIAKEQNEMRIKVASGEAKMKDPQVHLNFIRKLEEDLEELEQKIEEQKEEVKRAEKHLQRCRTNYIIAAQEMNMMEKHKELWHKKMNNQLSMEEQKVLNELGNVIHQLSKK
ncbi:MAG: hypothetical protein ABII18_06940 [bacterium]|nr:hypothetical protein [bacterium]MBU1918595.1 hypothetical protein [bacterium]